MRLQAKLAALIVAAFAFVAAGVAWAADGVTVFAAASLTDALNDIGNLYQSKTGNKITFVFAGSSQLAKQIENGAPADIFISADLDWMNYLETRHLIDSSTRRTLLSNELVLIAPADSTAKVKIGKGFDIAGLLGDGRLAVADTKSVPAGKYAKQALTELGVWSSVEGKLAEAENVRAALALVALGEAPYGIVYRTDAMIEPKVKVVGVFPESSHPPILYPIALTSSSTDPEARKVLGIIENSDSAETFTRLGFTVVKAH